MKRYKLDYTWNEDFTNPVRMSESPDGEWVRADDALALQLLIERIKSAAKGSGWIWADIVGHKLANALNALFPKPFDYKHKNPL